MPAPATRPSAISTATTAKIRRGRSPRRPAPPARRPGPPGLLQPGGVPRPGRPGGPDPLADPWAPAPGRRAWTVGSPGPPGPGGRLAPPSLDQPSGHSLMVTALITPPLSPIVIPA